MMAKGTRLTIYVKPAIYSHMESSENQKPTCIRNSTANGLGNRRNMICSIYNTSRQPLLGMRNPALRCVEDGRLSSRTPEYFDTANLLARLQRSRLAQQVTRSSKLRRRFLDVTQCALLEDSALGFCDKASIPPRMTFSALCRSAEGVEEAVELLRWPERSSRARRKLCFPLLTCNNATCVSITSCAKIDTATKASRYGRQWEDESCPLSCCKGHPG